MALSLNKPKLDNLAGDIWKSAKRLRGKFKAYEYQDVILPIIVIRRLEYVLPAGKPSRRGPGQAAQAQREGTRHARQGTQTQPPAVALLNKTKWTLRKIYEEDHTLLEAEKMLEGLSQ